MFRKLLVFVLTIVSWALAQPVALGQEVRSIEPVGRHRLEAGGVARVLRSGNLRGIPQGTEVSAETTPPMDPPLAVSWDKSGENVVLGVPSLTPPGEYDVVLSWVDERGRKSGERFSLTVDEMPRMADGSAVPVILLNGLQLGLLSSCPIASSSAETFGLLEQQIAQANTSVLFFDNCKECRDCSIERLGARLGQYISELRYTDGSYYSGQVDLVGHSMGGLIARTYLSGKQETSGLFIPPLNHRVRKLVTIGTPHFGSYKSADWGTQTGQLTPGSRFIWELATWNQLNDDLRGVDALAIAGNGCDYGDSSSAGDGMVPLTSASLSFARSDERTRIIPYRHSDSFYNYCPGRPLIAYVDSPSHPTSRIIRSFLQDTSDWGQIGHTPASDYYLRGMSGLTAALKDANDLYFSSITKMRLDQQSDLIPATVSGGISLHWSDWVLAGSHSLAFLAGGTNVGTGTFSLSAGGYAPMIFKFGPMVHAVRSQSGAGGPGLTIETGGNIVITGNSLAPAGSPAAVSVNGTPLSLVSTSPTQIVAYLPNFGSGIASLRVSNNTGQHTVNIMVRPPLAPALNITKTHSGNFTQGQTGATFTVSVSNSPSAGPTTSTLTVSESLPVGLSLVSMTGPGWSCFSTTCSRSDVLSPGYIYPPITVVVTVSQDAPAQVTNRVTVSGGGFAQATALDTTAINVNPASLNPAISSINPASAPAGSPGLTMTVTGTNFMSGAVVRWNQNGVTTNLVTQSPNATTLTGYVPSNLLATPGTALVTVANPTGQTSTGISFTIQQGSSKYPNRYLLSQVADGGGWRTSFNLINPSKSSINYQLRLKDNAANPLPLGLGLFPSSLIGGTLAPGAAVTLTSSQASTLVQGTGEVESTAPLIASAVFTNRIPGRPDYEAAVPALPAPAKSLLLPFDNQGGKATGVAVANTGETAANITFEFRSESGVHINSGSLPLGPGQKTEFSLTDRFPQAGGYRGTVLMKSDTPVLAALGLRFLPGGTFTTLPVHSPDPATPAIQRQVLSHVVDGAGWLSTITLLNLDSAPAPYQLRLHDQTGQPMALSLGGALNSSFVGVIPPLTSVTLTTPGTAGTLLEGWADLASSSRIRAQLMFDQVLPNSPVFEAAVPAIGDGHTALATPFDNTGVLVTSMAVANSGGSATTVQLTVRDENGTVMAVQSLNLGAGEKTAFELIKQVPSSAGRRGLVTITSQGSSISALALRFNGPAFTTLPVSPVDPITGIPK